MYSKVNYGRILNENRPIKKVINFLERKLADSGKKNYIIGYSGGIDSALVTVLAVMAVGSDHVFAYKLPYFEHVGNLIPADDYLDSLGLDGHYIEMSIKETVDSFSEKDNYRKGNIMARIRMTQLYNSAARFNALVLNTCNMSETLVGYETKYGDAAGDIAPIVHLTKTEVWKWGEKLGLPAEILNKVPTAGLWDGQTDEDELGFLYAELDTVIEQYRHNLTNIELYEWMDARWEDSTYSLPVHIKTWLKIRKLNKNSQHKLHPMSHFNWWEAQEDWERYGNY